MAQFSRGRGGRGGRGPRGARGSRGTSRGDGKLARSGIRTQAGYRKFDSQRVREVNPSDDENELPDVAEEAAQDSFELSEDDEVEIGPKPRAYNTLLESFQQLVEQDGRKRKRRKLDAVEEVQKANGNAVDHDEAGLDIEDGADAEEEDEREDQISGTLEEEDEGFSDPFEIHFANPDDNELSRRLECIQANDLRSDRQDVAPFGILNVTAPKCAQGSLIRKSNIKGPTDLKLKSRLLRSAQKHVQNFSPLQRLLAPHMYNYTDMLLGNRTPSSASELRQLTCLHALSHVLKGRDKVLKNNARLAHSNSEDVQDLDLRDQGFTRPKVLILTETRQVCYSYSTALASLFEPEQQENKQRFEASFNGLNDDNNENDSSMPEDYKELFTGNNDNNFLTALKFTRKTLKYYSTFYSSDILLASPLGLRRILENEDPKKRDHDFSSSIEIVIVDQADAMQMQNWENVETVFDHLNLQLKEARGCDFSRVRPWYLDGNAKFLRQTIVLSAYLTPEMNHLFNISMLNIAGKARLSPTYDQGAIAVVSNLGLGIKQTFSRFDAATPAEDPDARFKFFTTAVLPSLLRLPRPAEGGQGVLVFIPSYFDFLRLRNFFATSTQTENLSFGAIHEYSDVSSQRRARAHFLSGRHSFLLYTQRAHHFFRLRIKGVRRVVMYGLPEKGVFYEELVGGFLGTSLQAGMVREGDGVGVRCLFSKWDAGRLERVVGSGRFRGMLGGKGDGFEFV